jgi:hypothetical protein
MSKRFAFTVAVIALLTVGAWGQQTYDPAAVNPVIPSADFQHPYQYTPPQPSFVPNPPWTPNVWGDQDSTTYSCLDGALSVTGQGKLIAAYNYSHGSSGGWPWRISNSTNFGATWTGRLIMPGPNYQFDDITDGNKRDSCICLVMKNVSGYTLYFVRSTNSGVTWRDTLFIPQAASGSGVDYPKMDIRGPNILVGYYNTGGNGYIGVCRSTNWGTTWNASQAYVSNATGQGNCPRFSKPPSTNAYFMWGQPASWMPTTVWFNRSTDLGATWGTPTQVQALNMSSHLSSRRPTHSWAVMAIAPNGDICYSTMNMMQGNGWDIAFVKSTNQGTTWSTPVRVNDDVATPNADQFCPWTEVDYRGNIHIFWYDNRNYYSSNIYGTDLYYSYSTNGGTTWAPNERINDVSPLASVTGDFDRMGDFQIIDSDSSRVYCEWTHVNPQHTAGFMNTSTRLLPSGVEEKPTGNPWVTHRVDGIELAPSRPNPVLSGTELAFELENHAQASLRIYDLSGKLVRTLVTGSLAAGSHTARWDTRDESGKPVASGVYFYRLESSGLLATKQLVVTR